MQSYQRTVSQPIGFSGIGLHSGVPSIARIVPAAPDTGIVFRRTDLGVDIPASVENVVETAFATVIGRGGARVATIEHFLAALYAMEIDNAVVEVDGPELPILDGSALEVARALHECAPVRQPARRKFLRVWENGKIRRNGSLVTLAPSEEFELLVTVDFPGTAIGRQWAKFTLDGDSFLRDIAPARTFVLREQIDALRAAGFAKGGSLDNAIVVEGEKIHNNEGLRFPDEFARHKLLDLIGDIALLGLPVRGSFVAVRPGHTVNRELTAYLASLPDRRPALPAQPGKAGHAPLLVTA